MSIVKMVHESLEGDSFTYTHDSEKYDDCFKSSILLERKKM